MTLSHGERVSQPDAMTHAQLSLGSCRDLSRGRGQSHPLGDLCFHGPSRSGLRGLLTALRLTQKETKAPMGPSLSSLWPILEQPVLPPPSRARPGPGQSGWPSGLLLA